MFVFPPWPASALSLRIPVIFPVAVYSNNSRGPIRLRLPPRPRRRPHGRPRSGRSSDGLVAPAGHHLHLDWGDVRDARGVAVREVIRGAAEGGAFTVVLPVNPLEPRGLEVARAVSWEIHRHWAATNRTRCARMESLVADDGATAPRALTSSTTAMRTARPLMRSGLTSRAGALSKGEGGVTTPSSRIAAPQTRGGRPPMVRLLSGVLAPWRSVHGSTRRGSDHTRRCRLQMRAEVCARHDSAPLFCRS